MKRKRVRVGLFTKQFYQLIALGAAETLSQLFPTSLLDMDALSSVFQISYPRLDPKELSTP